MNYKRTFMLLCALFVFLPAVHASKIGAKTIDKFYDAYEADSFIPEAALLGKKEKPVVYYDNEGSDLQSLRQDNYYKVTGASAWRIAQGKEFSRKKTKGWHKDIMSFAELHKQKYAFVVSEKGESLSYIHKIYLLRPYTKTEMAQWKFWLEVRDLNEGENRRLAVDSGARVTVAFRNYPALRAGIQRGDIIVQIDGTVIKGKDDLTVFESAAQKGSTVSVHLVRNGMEKVIPVRL